MADLVAAYPAARATLGRLGMACVGCTMARFDTVGEAAKVYGYDAGDLLDAVTGRAGPPQGRRPHHENARARSSRRSPRRRRSSAGL